jgi:DNA polymerase V
MKCKVDIVYNPDMSTKRKQPLFEAKVPAGFPSPAADYEEDKLDLNRHLIKNPAATFFVNLFESRTWGRQRSESQGKYAIGKNKTLELSKIWYT